MSTRDRRTQIQITKSEVQLSLAEQGELGFFEKHVAHLRHSLESKGMSSAILSVVFGIGVGLAIVYLGFSIYVAIVFGIGGATLLFLSLITWMHVRWLYSLEHRTQTRSHHTTASLASSIEPGMIIIQQDDPLLARQSTPQTTVSFDDNPISVTPPLPMVNNSSLTGNIPESMQTSEDDEPAICPICQGNLHDGSEIIVCRKCKGGHHKRCWESTGGKCGVYGCDSLS